MNKKLFTIVLSLFFFCSCSQSGYNIDPYKRKERDDVRYWYYWKGVSFTESGGTTTSTKIYHIGDQVAGESGEVIEITSEGALLK